MPSCPPPLINHTTFADALKNAGVPLSVGSSIVNIGAMLPGKNDRGNFDWAWELARFTEVKLRIVAFEADAHNYKVLQQYAHQYANKLVLMKHHAKHSIDLVHTKVSATTIAPMLRSRGIRNDSSFALLKLDIDSYDLSIARSILDNGLRPTLIWAEFNQHVPLPIEFAAIEAASLSTPMDTNASTMRATYGHFGSNESNRTTAYRGFNRVWGCFGVSLAAWAKFATVHSYVLLLTLSNNVLLMRADAHARSGLGTRWSDDMWCHSASTHAQLYRLQLSMHDVRHWGTPQETNQSLKIAIAIIEKRCYEHETPYSLRVNGVCCPGVSGEARPGALRLCRCP